MLEGVGRMGSPFFGRSVNPISTRGGEAHYAYPITTCLPGFLDLATFTRIFLFYSEVYSRVPNRRTGRLLENEKKIPPIRTYLELYVY
jgi:hypothetical protein